MTRQIQLNKEEFLQGGIQTCFLCDHFFLRTSSTNKGKQSESNLSCRNKSKNKKVDTDDFRVLQHICRLLDVWDPEASSSFPLFFRYTVSAVSIFNQWSFITNIKAKVRDWDGHYHKLLGSLPPRCSEEAALNLPSPS